METTNTRSGVRGSVDECFKHFADHSQEKVGKALYKRHFLCEFAGVKYSGTGWEWFAGKSKPIGERRIKVSYFLELIGYKVKELEGMKTETRDFGRLLAFGVISTEDALAAVGINKSGLFRLLRGEIGTSKARLNGIKSALTSDRQDTLSSEIQKWSGKMGLPLSEASGEKAQQDTDTRTPTSRERVPAKSHQSGRRFLVETLAHLVIAAKPLAERVASDEFTPSDRELLRQLTAHGRTNDVFELSTMLNRLCGERARREM